MPGRDESMPPASCAVGTEPIAIIGMGCRFPGQAGGTEDIETPHAFWDFLQRKAHSYSDFPSNRINLDGWYHPKSGRPGSFYTRGGCFLKSDVRNFDNTFFGISPQETLTLDPAQRKLLETVYEAFESSGTPLSKLSGSSTGCFIGNFNYDHQLMQFRDTEYPQPYGMTGGGIALLSNRVSYVFNLHGPSLTLDTACSSSMYALHLACSAIQSGECSSAIVGGSNLILSPECQVFSAALGAVSKTSRCHTFDAAADGYARADGIGVLYIKSLTEAMRDGDPIRAVIRATAINANGRTGGITHPDADGQERAIRRAYARAGDLDPRLTSYFECHGTGTPVGDPLEVEAVGRVFAKGRTVEHPLLIGSVKSNIGHSESASGIAGIMKTVLALERGIIPPMMKVDRVNPNVDLHDGRLSIVQESSLWPAGALRRASVNSFGYGGANAHTILEQAEGLAPAHSGVSAALREARSEDGSSGQNSPDEYLTDEIRQLPEVFRPGLKRRHNDTEAGPRKRQANFRTLSQTTRIERQWFLLPFSAHNEQTLKGNMKAICSEAHRWRSLDLAYTLGCRRTTFSTRSFVVMNRDETISRDTNVKVPLVRKPKSSGEPKIGFVFTGQGAQWPQMGLDLMRNFPVFLQSIRSMDEVLQRINWPPDWSIESSLNASAGSSRVYEAAMSQPLVTAVQVALVDLLSSWNVRPTVSVGHSSGEIAAAYASGRISAAEAIVAAYARGKAVSRNTQQGAMLATDLDIATATSLLKDFPSVSIACYNSPESLTLSGDYLSVNNLKVHLDSQGRFARLVETGGNAYHSSHMRILGQSYETDLQRLLENLAPEHINSRIASSTQFVSSVTNEVFTHQPINAAYWRRNLESPVLFSQALTTLVESSNVEFLLEIGPHSALRGPVRQISKIIEQSLFPEYMPSLIRSKNGAECLLQTVGCLFTAGAKIDFRQVNLDSNLDSVTGLVTSSKKVRVIIDLPKYQWQYGQPIYSENRWTQEWRSKTHARHDLLGSRVPGGNENEPMWRNILKNEQLPWLKDHMIGQDVVFPAAGYVTMAVEAAAQMLEIKKVPRSDAARFECQNLQLTSALVLPEVGPGVETLLNLRRSRINSRTHEEKIFEFTVTSVTPTNDGNVFTEHATGSIKVHQEVPHSSAFSYPLFPKKRSASQWYKTFSRVGLNYGPDFQCLSNIETHEKENVAKCHIRLNPTGTLIQQESNYIVHPAALDGTLQSAIVAAYRGRSSDCEAAYIPVYIESISLLNSSIDAPLGIAVSQSTVPDHDGFSADITLVSDEQKLVEIKGLRLVKADSIVQPPTHPEMHPFTRMVWRPDLDLLTPSKFALMHKSAERNATDPREMSAYEKLALHQILQLHAEYPHFFTNGSEIPSVNRFLAWMAEKVELAKNNLIPDGLRLSKCSIEERAVAMDSLYHKLRVTQGPETNLMWHMYKSFPSIYRGELSGIQAAVQHNYLSDMYEHMELFHAGSVALKDLLLLISHNNPQLNIFEIGGGTGSATREVLKGLRGDKLYRGYQSYTFTDITPSFLANAQDEFQCFAGVQYSSFDMEVPVADQGFGADHDVVIASNVIHASSDILKTLQNIRGLLKTGGKLALFEIIRPEMNWLMILGTFSDVWKGDNDPNYPRSEGPFLTLAMWNDLLPKCGFTGVDLDLSHFAEHRNAAVIMATATEMIPIFPEIQAQRVPVTLVYRNHVSSFISSFQHYLELHGYTTEMIPLVSAKDLREKRVISLAEVEAPLFTTITEAEWIGFQETALHTSSTLWITRGGLLDGRSPEHAIMSGLTAAAHTENSACRLILVDVDHADNAEHQFHDLMKLEQRAAEYSVGDDFEYRSRAGVFHTSRLMDDEALNAGAQIVASSQNSETKVKDLPIEIESQVADLALPLAEDNVEIKVHAAGLTDAIFQPSVRAEKSGSFSNEFSGLVTDVGTGIHGFRRGDRVYGLCFDGLGKNVRVPASFCQQMKQKYSYEHMAALPSAACIALYGLLDAGRLCRGETVLIHSTNTSVATLAIQVGLQFGATVITVTKSDQEEALFLASCKSTGNLHTISSQQDELTGNIMRLSNGKGINLVLSDIRGDLLQEYWQCLSPLGRFVDFGTSTPLDCSTFKYAGIRHMATFTSFNLEQLGRLRPDIIGRLMARTAEMLDTGELLPPEIESSTVSDVSSKISGQLDKHNLTKPVLQYDSQVRTEEQTRTEIKFDPEASYLLTGGLGGLGRSLTNWMIMHGARNFVFLSRSGTHNSDAADFIARLRGFNIDAQVILGNVCNLADVQKAFAASALPFKGVVHAALSLEDSLLHNMPLDKFRSTLLPRVVGAQNLHKASEGLKLDFFMMWSSWTNVLGSVSQGNYMASCAFMDAFAHYRQQLKLPATSLVLGHIQDVGIVSEHLEYQDHLIRMGLYGNSEKEFLQFCKVGMLHAADKIPEAGLCGQGQLLVGMDPEGLRTHCNELPISEMHWAGDARFSFLVQAYRHLTSSGVEEVLQVSDDDDTDSLINRIRKRVARALYMPIEDIDTLQPINRYGIDSMVAAEIRNWLHGVLGVQISLLNLLHPTMSVEKLTGEVLAMREASKGNVT